MQHHLIRILIPLALQGILSVAIGMVDSMMVSNKGEAAFAGVSLIGSLDTVLITLFGVLLFKEKLRKTQWIAMATILVSVVLLNI